MTERQMTMPIELERQRDEAARRMDELLAGRTEEGGGAMKYVVVYERTPSGWSAYVPDLPGCVAAGKTRTETERLIREAIALHLEGLRAENAPIPEPSAWAEAVEVPA